MTTTIVLPLWLVLAICALALFGALDRLLMPSVRWFVRRRVNRVIDELNSRLELRIQSFNLTRRQVLIDRLMYDPEVLQAVEIEAHQNDQPREVVMAEVERYAKEIVPSFNAYAYFRVGSWLARNCARLLYRVRLGYADDVGLSGVDPKASVVFIMNHRSNMDYILVAHLAATRTALSYAVGEWARIWPLQTLIRSLGAYFVRRDSGDPLYRRVLARYINMAIQGGVVQAVYPEGGLSRDGRIRPPKLGLLAYMVAAFDPQGERDLVFVPVGINYDRVLEDRSLVRRLDPTSERRGRTFALATTLRFIGRHLGLMARRRWYRFGYASVNFGAPISLRDYLARRGIDFRALGREERFAEVEALGQEMMAEVGKVIPVLPVSLVATALLRGAGEWLSELELKAAVHDLIGDLRAAGAHLYLPRQDHDYAVVVGLRMLILRHLVDENDGLYRAAPDERPLLTYYANGIAHLFDGGAAA
jgi:glycerol-3-phosphate O-acyltransferase